MEVVTFQWTPLAIATSGDVPWFCPSGDELCTSSHPWSPVSCGRWMMVITISHAIQNVCLHSPVVSSIHVQLFAYSSRYRLKLGI